MHTCSVHACVRAGGRAGRQAGVRAGLCIHPRACMHAHAQQTYLPQQKLRHIESKRVWLVLQDQPHLLLFNLKLSPLRLLQLLQLLKHLCESLERSLASNGVMIEHPRACIARRVLDLVLVVVVADL